MNRNAWFWNWFTVKVKNQDELVVKNKFTSYHPMPRSSRPSTLFRNIDIIFLHFSGKCHSLDAEGVGGYNLVIVAVVKRKTN